MENTNNRSNKMWIGFGVITVLSGIFLFFSGDYLVGCSGSAVGCLLIYQNMMVIKNGSNESGFEETTCEPKDEDNLA